MTPDLAMSSASPFSIDPATGAITLPDGTVIHPNPVSEPKDSRLGWLHQPSVIGDIDGKPLHVTRTYFDQELVTVSLMVDHYPPEATGWEHFSLDIEAETKRFHDAMLQRMFGPPSETFDMGGVGLGRERTTLAIPHRWKFTWGEVFSSHDSRGGNTQIIVNYGNRAEQANRIARQRLDS